MLLGFNLLLWATHVTEEHLPLLDILKRTGYDLVEIPIFQGEPEDYARIGRAARDAGLRVTGVTVLPDEAHSAISADPTSRAGAVRHIAWAVDCLEAAGGELLCGPFHQPLGVFSGLPASTAERGFLAETHRIAADDAGKRGIKLAIEPLNRFECHVLNTVEDSAAVVKAVDRPNYGLLYDTFHQNIEEKDPVGVILPNLGQINHVHLSENDRGTPGKGHVPFVATLKVFKQAGYQGFYVIEAFSSALPGLAAATRCWRDFFPNREEVYRFGHDFLRDAHAKA